MARSIGARLNELWGGKSAPFVRVYRELVAVSAIDGILVSATESVVSVARFDLDANQPDGLSLIPENQITECELGTGAACLLQRASGVPSLETVLAYRGMNLSILPAAIAGFPRESVFALRVDRFGHNDPVFCRRIEVTDEIVTVEVFDADGRAGGCAAYPLELVSLIEFDTVQCRAFSKKIGPSQ